MNKKIAIVYDWIDKWGGVERVLLTLKDLYPEAVFYTSFYDAKKAPWATSLSIKTSFMQRLPRFIKSSRVLSALFFPFAFESFDLSDYDCVVSVCSAYSKGVITRPETHHVCYLLTPTRFLWFQRSLYQIRGVFAGLAAIFVRKQQEWDSIAAQRPDAYISISQCVAERCKTIYHRESEVVYPPFPLEYWESTLKNTSSYTSKVMMALRGEPFYLIVSRLEKYKRIDLVIEAFKHTNKRLVMVGTGTQKNSLNKKMSSNIMWIEHLEDRELVQLYSHAEALIMPQEEDFGYVALEAQLFGCPVIAYGKGGALETVKKDKTGLFFDEQSSTGISSAVARFEKVSYNLKRILKNTGRDWVQQFSTPYFVKKFTQALEKDY
ncbi:glycosyltransferase family 4 protein [Candidatus Roizmanbacteria bacterium]|nr:glycosyltransferase family 4 protein [Candidatus Roizmanbacteria bacterium]